MPTRTLLKDLVEGDLLDGVYSILDPQVRPTKTGDSFLSCELGDRCGRLAAKRWKTDAAEAARLGATGFARVTGRVESYNGQRQVVLEEMEPVEPEAAQLRELLPSSPYAVEGMLAEVRERLSGVRHEGLRGLVGAYLGDAGLMEKFCACPAAMKLHHAYLGGLLEHTLNLLRLADAVCPLYPRMSRDVVTVGVFIHDMAKVREQSWERGFAYTPRGQLVGHVVDGVLMLRGKVKAAREAGASLSEELVMCLEHIVLSHHGQPEHGAARLPMTPEAILVHYLDNIDAKMAIALEATRPNAGGGASAEGGAGSGGGAAGGAGGEAAGLFTEKMWALENVRLYRADPAGRVDSVGGAGG